MSMPWFQPWAKAQISTHDSVFLPMLNQGVSKRRYFDDLPLVRGDEQATRTALQHLLQNAVDATQRGYVRLSATVQDSRIQIEIEDSGTGIAAQHRDSIFEPFYQGDKAKSGLGLGLNIARGLIEQQQGDLQLRQISHEGTIFVCTLPSA